MKMSNGNTAENTPLDGPAGAANEEFGDEGSVNWDAAKEVFQPKGQGGTTEPGDGEGDQIVYVDEEGNELTPEEVEAARAEGAEIDGEGGDGAGGDPEMVEVRVKGRTITLPREDAEAFESFRRETRERDGRMGGELQQTRERLAALEAVVVDRNVATKPTAPQKPPWKLATENFQEYEKQWDAYVDHKIATSRNELVEAYNEEMKAQKAATMSEQANQAWVAGFYSENKHLNKPMFRPTVGQVFKENEQELESYGNDVESAYARLAELAEARLTEVATQGRTLRRPPRFEGGTRTVRQVTKSPRDTTPFSTANWIAKERAKMRGEETE
jgi:hypothetical protein